MRYYNVVTVTRDQNPNIVEQLVQNAQCVQFDPNKGKNRMVSILPNGKKETIPYLTVKSTYRYNKVETERGIVNCGDRAIIVLKNGHIVLDFVKDEVKVF